MRILLIILCIPHATCPFIIKNFMSGPLSITLTVPDTDKTDTRVLAQNQIIRFEPTKSGQDFLSKGGKFRLQFFLNIAQSRLINSSNIDTYFILRDDGASVCCSPKTLVPLGQALSPIFDGYLTPQFMTGETSIPWCTDTDACQK